MLRHAYAPAVIVWTLAVTLVAEVITLAVRYGTGLTAVEFNKTAPLLMQFHHMFWSLPILFALPLLKDRPQWFAAILGVALGLIASDLVHHFAVLPLLVGHTGWHWP